MKPLSITEINAAAAAGPSHPQFHFAWGQLLGEALLGLAGFEGGPTVWANPVYLQGFIGGVSSLFGGAPK